MLVNHDSMETCQGCLRYNLFMSRTATITGDQLTNALRALGVKFLMGGKQEDKSLHKQPRRLIAALAESGEARLRLSLIPLFLEHPEFSVHVRAIARNLHPSARLTLQCYYSAAVWLRTRRVSPNTPIQRLDAHVKLLSSDLGRAGEGC